MKQTLILIIALITISCAKDSVKYEYYPSGSLKREYNVVDGEIDGEIKEYYEDGTLKGVATLKNGVKHGVFTQFHPNGKKRVTYINENGVSAGIVSYYDSSGMLERENLLNEQLKCVLWEKRYNPDGQQSKSMRPLLCPNPRKVPFTSKSIEFEIRLGNIPDSSYLSGSLIIGKGLTANFSIQDTMAIIECQNYCFQYEYLLTRKGKDTLIMSFEPEVADAPKLIFAKAFEVL